MIKIVAISGSLRRISINTALLKAAAALAPREVEIALYSELQSLPPFNPDLEGLEPAAVLSFRQHLRKADGVLITSPEYAHGVTGVLKNALDWIVGSGELINKPVALLNTSARATHAQASLNEIIKTMDAHIVMEASTTIPLPKTIDQAEILASVELSTLLRSAIVKFACAIKPEICFSLA